MRPGALVDLSCIESFSPVSLYTACRVRAVLVLGVRNRLVTLYFALSVYIRAVLKGSRVTGSGILKMFRVGTTCTPQLRAHATDIPICMLRTDRR